MARHPTKIVDKRHWGANFLHAKLPDNFDPDFDKTICRKFQLNLSNLPS